MVFDSLIATHSGITYTATSVEKIYIEQALKLLPTHVLSKIITEGWKIVVYDDVNELITIDNQLSTGTTGVTEYEMRRVFVKGVVDGRNEIAFKSTLLHELTHVFDAIIDGSYCNWKSEKYYNSELENLITQEGSNFSEYAQSDVKEYLCTVVSRYLLNQTDFSTVPLTKAFIEKYYFMCEDSIEQRLRNLENNAVTYIELDETYNRLKYSKLNKENDKYTIQLPQTSSGGTSSGSGDNNVIYDNNVTFSTSVSYFSLNKTTISYITESLDSNTTGTWELKTIMGSTSAIAIQIRTFILNGRDSAVTNFTTLPNVQMRYFDYNSSRSWSSWVDKISTLETRVSALENSGGSTGGSGEADGYGEKLLAHYIHQGNQEIQFTSFDYTTCEGTTSSPHGLTKATEVIVVPNDWTLSNRKNGILSIPTEWVFYDSIINLVPVDDITLKVTKNDGATLLPVDVGLDANQNVDITKFHFEVTKPWSISNLEKSTNYFRILIKGFVKPSTYRYFMWKITDSEGKETVQTYPPLYGIAIPTNGTPRPFNADFSIHDLIFDFRDGLVNYNCLCYIEGRRAGYSHLVWDLQEEKKIHFDDIKGNQGVLSYIGNFSEKYSFNSNGTHVYIYDLGGTL